MEIKETHLVVGQSIFRAEHYTFLFFYSELSYTSTIM